MALLEITNLNVQIEDEDTGQAVKLIDNFSLSVSEGELCALVGETGSGKSVIARILGGYIKKSWHITCASFRFDGQELLIDNHTINIKPLAGKVGIIYQDPANVIDPTQKIGKQILNQMKNSRKLSKQKALKELNELLTRLGIKEGESILSSYYSELSQTERHLIAILMTLATDPLFLIADEPTTGLNSVSILRVQSLFKRLNANFGKSILYLSNNFINIRNLAHSAHILYFGQVVERFTQIEDIQGEMINYAHHPYTRQFLQSLPNFSKVLMHKAPLYSIPGQLPELSSVPLGCRFGPRCEFAQRECMKFPTFVKDKTQGHSEFACHCPVDYVTPQESLYIKEVRERIKKEVEESLARSA